MKHKTLITLCILFVLYQTSMAQKSFDDDIDDETGSEESVPIDGGILWLLAGAAVYGIKKHRVKEETLAIQQEHDKRLK